MTRIHRFRWSQTWTPTNEMKFHIIMYLMYLDLDCHWLDNESNQVDDRKDILLSENVL